MTAPAQQGLPKPTGGTLILTGTNTYTGGTTISGGTLQLGNGGTTGRIMGNVMDNGTLAFDRSDSVTFGGTISGTGNLVQGSLAHADGTLTLTGTNNYSGGTLVNRSTLAVENDGNFGTGALTRILGLIFLPVAVSR